MGIKYETVEVKKAIGMICDRCKKDDDMMMNDFAANHTFGYDSRRDTDSVSFTLCDNCLEVIILENIPNAVWEDETGNVIK